ncbi:L-aspartate oxidase [Psychrobacter sp.]|uniref:L-aspartate oxidase n=2 Tax=Psychrobacter sp. TaxID=56811 RepID=UPI002648EA15|nr:FAD-dependent oxidoreductase [Psychrobacter sp.]MDN6275089.1 FAD-dependent oxidoreductase [Psychrobacter sp.]MDN6307316.1 FAD-dependent oxidoreductase [Psychrobacter sp.]
MNERLTDDMTNDNADNTQHTDVLIIGAGLAGLTTALALPRSLHITVLSKAAIEVCSSHYAQGGIAASLNKDDCAADHIADTLVAGAGLCAAKNTTHILTAGQQAVQWLCEQGVPFTQIPQQNTFRLSPTKSLEAAKNLISIKKMIQTTGQTLPKALATLQTSELHLTKEGGHGCRRVAHADDATGRHIMEALIRKAQAASNITILPYHEALSLITNSSLSKHHLQYSETDHCQGACVFDHAQQRTLTLSSRAVVLASGGLGQMFKRASAPNVCVGDGVMMAWQAGCRLANLEFIQFHPTGLALHESSFLISEALRGEGGRLYCPQTGQRFMLQVDERAELAPRDIVARAIAEQIDNNGLGYVHLDISHLPAPFIQMHFPQIYQTLLDLGIDITTDPIPVAPTAHYSCGGVVTSSNGLTDIPGLYAVGEVAYTGLHGANRLASNSLLECVVVGRNIAVDLPRYLKDIATNIFKENTDSASDQTDASFNKSWSQPALTDSQPIILPASASFFSGQEVASQTDKIDHKSSIDTDADIHIDVAKIIVELKALMTSHMGIVRHAEQLEQALSQIQQWQQQLLPFNYQQPDISNIGNITSPRKLPYFQLQRQLQLATLIIHSAYQRCESRGGHYRRDYPNLADKPLTSIIAPLKRPVTVPHTHMINNEAQPKPVMNNA